MRFVQTNLNAISSGSEIEQPDNVLEPIVLFKGTLPLIIVIGLGEDFNLFY